MSGTGAILLSAAVEAARGEALDRVAGGMRRVVLRAGADEVDSSGVTVACFSNDLFPDVDRELCRRFWRSLRDAPALAWLHSCSAGIDDAVFQRLLDRGVRLSTASGAAATPIAHTVLLYLLAHTRGLRQLEAARARHEWRPREVVDLEGRLVGVVGLGPIGREVARLATAFGMRVIGVRRSPEGDEPCETWPLRRLPELLPLVDFLVLALPLSAETRGILDRPALARLRSEAFVVNVGRGGLVDEPALIDALAGGRLAGAALDVFAEEPLPAASPLWDLPGVIVTPHCAGETALNRERALDVFVENLPRWLAGAPLRNQVDPGDRRA